ncbi:MAG: hypothetical protein EXR93_09305 [Gemmatimonadetes bacterium]|nr:hypothetical protein [Gemmatimonadota bacterium]
MRRIGTVLAVVSVGASACMTGPLSVAGSPGAYLAANPPSRAWVVLNDDRHLVVDGPQVISDTLFGFTNGNAVTIASDQLRDVKVRRLSVFRTALIPGALMMGAVAGVVFVKSLQPTVDPWDGNSHDDENSPGGTLNP